MLCLKPKKNYIKKKFPLVSSNSGMSCINKSCIIEGTKYRYMTVTKSRRN